MLANERVAVKIEMGFVKRYIIQLHDYLTYITPTPINIYFFVKKFQKIS